MSEPVREEMSRRDWIHLGSLVLMSVLFAGVILFLSGCRGQEVDNNWPSPYRTLEWKEEPFQKVRGYEDLRNYVAAVWVTGQKGDKFEASQKKRLMHGRLIPSSVSLIRKDETKQIFPTVVHHPERRFDKLVTIKTYHLIVNGKEVDSFEP